MTAAEAEEIAVLRAEVTRLRRDLDRALERLDLPGSRDPDGSVPEFSRVEFENVAVRHSRMQIPIIIHSDAQESGVYLYDARQQVRGRFCVWPDGQARLEFLNAEGKVVVTLGEGPEGRGEIVVQDADGTPRAGLKANEHGGAVSVVDARGKTLATMVGGAEGGQVFICTPGQKAVVTLRSAPEGGLLTLAEPGGQTMGVFAVREFGAALSVYGEQGMPAATLAGLTAFGGRLSFYTVDGEPAGMWPGIDGTPPEDG